jgi:hypothetical protein
MVYYIFMYLVLAPISIGFFFPYLYRAQLQDIKSEYGWGRMGHFAATVLLWYPYLRFESWRFAFAAQMPGSGARSIWFRF